MKIDYFLTEGSVYRALAEVAVRSWQMKREVARAFGVEIGPWMTYRKLQRHH